MGTYNAATIRGLAVRQAKANQQSVMRSGDFGKHAELGLKPTPRQLRRKELKLEIASLEVEISSLVRADNFDTAANRSALVMAIAQYLRTSVPLQKNVNLPEIPLGNISAKLNNENGISIGFSGRTRYGGSLSGYELPTDADLRAEGLWADVYVLVTDGGMRADSIVEFKVYDRDYVYLNDQIWEYLVSECSLQTPGCYLRHRALVHGSFEWNPGYYLSTYAPLYGVKRHITVLKDETLEEELMICPVRARDTKLMTIPKISIPEISIPEICRQLGPERGLEYDDRGVGCLLRHPQPITKDDVITDLVIGSVKTINQTPTTGLYRTYGYDCYECGLDWRNVTEPQLDVSGRTYNMFVVEAQAIFDRCQQYYDILQDALKQI